VIQTNALMVRQLVPQFMVHILDRSYPFFEPLLGFLGADTADPLQLSRGADLRIWQQQQQQRRESVSSGWQ